MGGYTHYDAQNNKTGTSDPNLTGGYTHSGGCYVATCVYGSYDCLEVWVLRRYRDRRLSKTFFGRMFIRIYYTVSPTIVRWFGERSSFQKFWRKRLDKMVKKLQEEGIENTPYKDEE